MWAIRSATAQDTSSRKRKRKRTETNRKTLFVIRPFWRNLTVPSNRQGGQISAHYDSAKMHFSQHFGCWFHIPLLYISFRFMSFPFVCTSLQLLRFHSSFTILAFTIMQILVTAVIVVVVVVVLEVHHQTYSLQEFEFCKEISFK